MALELGRGKRVNIYTDSHYVFASLHVHRTIYQERRLLITEGKTIKNKQEVLNLLKAIWDPKQVSVIHCPGHQKRDSTEVIGNKRLDQPKRRQPKSHLILVLLPAPTLPGVPPTQLRMMTSSGNCATLPPRKDGDSWLTTASSCHKPWGGL